MAIFHIDIMKYDSHIGEIVPRWNIDFADFHRSAQTLIGLSNKLLNNAILKQKNWCKGGDNYSTEGERNIKK